MIHDGTGEHKLPSGERADVRSFYCRDVGLVAQLLMVQGAWREGLELEETGPMPAPTARRMPAPGAVKPEDRGAQPRPTPTPTTRVEHTPKPKAGVP